MRLNESESIGKSIEIKSLSRPIKVAYIVGHDDSTRDHIVLDAVFYESYTRWGGVYTLIIPSNYNEFLYPEYKLWIEYFDPDFIYSYLELEEGLISEIDRLCSPIAFLYHELTQREPDDIRWAAFIPKLDSYISPLSSITTIHSPRTIYHIPSVQDDNDNITIVTQYGTEVDNRFVRDNYGTAFHASSVTYGIKGLFRTLCLIPSELPEHVHAGDETCTTILEVLSAVSSRQALPICHFSMMHSDGIPKVKSMEWSRCFNLFIGKTPIDRIHFWNARHFVPGQSGSGAMIIGMNDCADDKFIEQLAEYLSKHNYIGSSGGPYQVSLRSYSHSNEELDVIREKIQGKTYNSVFISENFSSPVMPNDIDIKNSIKSRSYIRVTDNIRVSEDDNNLKAKEPEHYAYIPPRYKELGRGQ